MSLNFKCRSMSESGLLILPWFLPSHVPEENLWEDKVSKVYAGQMPFLSLSVSPLKAAYDTWSDNCTSPLPVQIFQRIPANSLQSRRTIPDLVKLWIVSFYVTEYMLIFRPHCKHSIRCSIVLQMSVYLSCVSVCLCVGELCKTRWTDRCGLGCGLGWAQTMTLPMFPT